MSFNLYSYSLLEKIISNENECVIIINDWSDIYLATVFISNDFQNPIICYEGGGNIKTHFTSYMENDEDVIITLVYSIDNEYNSINIRKYKIVIKKTDIEKNIDYKEKFNICIPYCRVVSLEYDLNIQYIDKLYKSLQIDSEYINFNFKNNDFYISEIIEESNRVIVKLCINGNDFFYYFN